MSWFGGMAGGVVLALLAAASQRAGATVLVQYSLSGAPGSYTAFGSSSVDDFLFGAGIGGSLVGTTGFRLKSEFASNAPGSNDALDPTRLIASTTTIKNTGPDPRTLYLIIAGDEFLTPVTSPDVGLFNDLTKTGTIMATGASVSVTALSCVTQGSVLSSQSCIGTPTPGVNFTLGTTGGTSQATVSTLAASYTVSQFVAVSLSSGATISFQETSRLISEMPEPGSVAILGIGLIGLGAVRHAWRRRD